MQAYFYTIIASINNAEALTSLCDFFCQRNRLTSNHTNICTISYGPWSEHFFEILFTLDDMQMTTYKNITLICVTTFSDPGSKWWQSWIPPEPVTPLTTCTPNPTTSATHSCQSAPHHHQKQKRFKGHFRRKSKGLLPLHSPLRSIPLGGGGRGRSKERPRRWQA